MKNKFTDDDKAKVIDFLNFVAANATFNVNTDSIIKYYSLLSHMQKAIIPKIDSNIFEVIAITPPASKSEEDA